MLISNNLRVNLLASLLSTILVSSHIGRAGLPFADSSARAGCLLYQTLAARGGSENIAIAPTNLCEALAMLTAGAHGASKRQLEAFVASGFAAEHLAGEAQRLRHALTSSGAEGPRFSVANGLFCQREWQPQEAFRHTLDRFYGASPQSVDFRGDPQQSLEIINGWIAHATEQRIPRLLGPGSLDRTTRMVLASTLYFQGDWLVPFESRSTRPRTFYGADGSCPEIPTMELTGLLRVGEAPGLTTVALPYQGGSGAYSLVIMVPDPGIELAQLEHQLTPQWLSALLRGMHQERIHLYFPRFELNSRSSMLSALEALGLTALRGEQADFRGIHDTEPLQVSGVEHQVVVCVHEKGTEVAAATSIGMRCTAYQEVPVVRVNRPFLFALVEEHSGAILVLGRLCSPQI